MSQSFKPDQTGMGTLTEPTGLAALTFHSRAHARNGGHSGPDLVPIGERGCVAGDADLDLASAVP